MEKPKIGRILEASQVQAQCYTLLDEIQRTGKGVLVTKNGKPHVELLPYRAKTPSAGTTTGRSKRRKAK